MCRRGNRKGVTIMATIESRLLVLERTAANSEAMKPVPFFILPGEADPRRADIQAEISARERAGQRMIVYEIV